MTEASFLELASRRKESGLTVRDFCSNEAIPQSTYYYWTNRLKKKAAQPKGFIPIFVSSHLPVQKRNQHLRPFPIGTEPDHDDNQFEFVFPNGTRLLLRNQVDLALLQSIAHLYD